VRFASTNLRSGARTKLLGVGKRFPYFVFLPPDSVGGAQAKFRSSKCASNSGRPQKRKPHVFKIIIKHTGSYKYCRVLLKFASVHLSRPGRDSNRGARITPPLSSTARDAASLSLREDCIGAMDLIRSYFLVSRPGMAR
jgi:hypothetical protein